MVTAKVEHRDYIPYGWIAITFCRIQFFEPNSNKFENGWREIEHSIYQKYFEKETELKTKYIQLTKEKDELFEAIKNNKPWFRFWFNSEENKRIDDINRRIAQAERAMQNHKDEKPFPNKRRAVEKYLMEQGFVLTHTSSSGAELITHTDIWTKQ